MDREDLAPAGTPEVRGAEIALPLTPARAELLEQKNPPGSSPKDCRLNKQPISVCNPVE